MKYVDLDEHANMLKNMYPGQRLLGIPSDRTNKIEEFTEHLSNFIRAALLMHADPQPYKKQRANVDDLVQKITLHALEKFDQYKQLAPFHFWVSRMCRRMQMNDGMRVRQHQSLGPDSQNIKQSRQHDPAQNMLNDEETALSQAYVALAQTYVAELNPIYRDVIKGFYFEDKSLNDLRQEQDAPLGTIKRRLHTARQLLRSKFDDDKTLSR